MRAWFMRKCVDAITPEKFKVRIMVCFVLFRFSIPFIIFALFFPLSLLVVTQIRGHIAGSSPPLPTTVRAFHF